MSGILCACENSKVFRHCRVRSRNNSSVPHPAGYKYPTSTRATVLSSNTRKKCRTPRMNAIQGRRLGRSVPARSTKKRNFSCRKQLLHSAQLEFFDVFTLTMSSSASSEVSSLMTYAPARVSKQRRISINLRRKGMINILVVEEEFNLSMVAPLNGRRSSENPLCQSRRRYCILPCCICTRPATRECTLYTAPSSHN
jgi:hypothetical protein